MWFFLWDPERDGGKSVSLFWKVEKIQYTLMVIERCQTPPASLPLLLHSLFSLSHHFSPGQSLQSDRGCRLPLMFVTNDFFLLRYVWQRLRCVTPTKSSCSYAGVLNLKKKKEEIGFHLIKKGVLADYCRVIYTTLKQQVDWVTSTFSTKANCGWIQ